jgi:hypothetical protein
MVPKVIQMRDITAKELLIIQIEIGRPTTDWAFGKQLLELFASHDKRLAPQTLSIWGDKIADLSALEDAQSHWAGIGTMRDNGSLREFHVGVGWHRKLTTIPAKLSVYAKPHKAIDWSGFANRLYELTEAQYGFAHLYRDAHLRADFSEAREPTWITEKRTATPVPQLGWSTFLGEPYANLVPSNLSQHQGVSVDQIGAGVAITLTDNVMDVSDDFGSFKLKRAELKASFPKLFFGSP